MLDPRNTHEKNFGLMKYQREKILNTRNTNQEKSWTHERKFLTHEIPTRGNFGPTKYSREEIMDTRNTNQKKSWTREIPTRGNFEHTKYPPEEILKPSKYPREEILDPRNTHERTFRTHEDTMGRRRETHQIYHTLNRILDKIRFLTHRL